MSIKKIIHWLVLLFLFLLPWHTRLIYDPAYLNGGFWEYGTGSLFATELLLLLIIMLFAFDMFRRKELWQKILTREHFKSYKVYLFISSRQRRVHLWWILVLVFFGLQIIFSDNPKISFNYVFRLLEGACLVVVLASPPFQGGVADVTGGRGGLPFGRLLAFWLGGVVQGALALWQFCTQTIVANKWFGIAAHNASQLGDFVIETSNGERWLRAYGAFGSPNMLGGFLAVCWIVGLVLYIRHCRGVLIYAPQLSGQRHAQQTDNRPDNQGVYQYAPTIRWRILISIGQLIILSGLIFSFSRGAWIAAVGGVIVLFAVHRARAYIPAPPREQIDGIPLRRDNTPLRVIGLQFLYSLILVSCFLFLFTPLFTTRFAATTRLEIKSLTERKNQYEQAWQIIKENPVWGVGPGTYTLALYNQNPNLPVWQYQPVHNSYLLILSEIGIVGLFLVFLFSCFIALPRRSSIERRRVSLLWRSNPIFLPVLAVLFISAFFDHFWWSLYGGMMVWWAVLGLFTRRP